MEALEFQRSISASGQKLTLLMAGSFVSFVPRSDIPKRVNSGPDVQSI